MGRTGLLAKLARTLLPALLLALTCLGAHAQSGNALDRIDFGSPASEATHAFNPGGGTPAPSGTGAYGQPFRQPYGAGATLTSQTELVFTLKCDPNLQNYLTVRLWGSDTQGEYLSLVGSRDAIDSNGGPPPFPGRFHYETAIIPLSMTQGQTSVQLTLYPSGADTSKPARPIYSAFTHTDPHFVPSPSDPTGVKPAQDGHLAPTAALTRSQVIAQLQAFRQSIYGSGGYYNGLIAGQIPAGTTGAPPEVIGLHLGNSIASEVSANLSPEQWRNDAYNGGGGGPGYSKLPDQMISALVSTYLLPPFTDAGGNTVSGLDHYHDSTIITRLVSAFDGCTYLQVGDGGFGQYYGEWQGLCSTPRDSTSQWPNTTARAPGWSLSLEGVDSQALGYAIIQLLNDPTAAPVFKNYLGQSYDADFSGTPLLRAYAYERMLSNHAKYLYNIAGGTESQNLFQELGMYACEIALDKLQALYPNSSYTGVGPAAAVTRMEQVLGLVPDTTMGGTDPAYYGSGGAGLVNYGISLGGFGEAHGLLSCGYDGRYGQILPWLAPDFVRLAALDPSVPAPVLAQAEAMTRATIDGYDQFISPGENAGYTSGQFYDHFTLAQEDYITYRDPYNPNADGNSFEVNSQYPASDPTEPLSDAYALRSAYLQGLYGVTPGIGSGGHAYVQYLKDLGAYEASLRSLIGVDPATLRPLPGEPGQPNSAFVDAQTGTVALYYNGERFYMNADWQNFDKANPQQFGTVSNLARIHDTTGTVDLAALIEMPHDATTVQGDGNLTGALSKGWVVRYGPFLLAGNNTEDGGSPSNITINLPAGTGSAQELVSGRTYALGSSVTLTPGQGAAFVLPGAGSTGNGTAPTLADGYYTLTNAGSGLLADDQANGLAPGAPVDQAAGTGGFPQKWFLSNLGGGNIRLTNPYSNLVLDTASSGGAAIVQNPINFGPSQSWHLTASGGGYTLTNLASGLVLDVPGGSTSPGTVLDQAAATGAASQQWQFTPVSLIPNGTYTITNAASGQVFDKYGPTTDYQRVAQNPPTGTTNQQWKVTNLGNSIINFADVADGQYVQVIFGATDPGGQLAGAGNFVGSNAIWQLAPVGGGRVAITGLASGLPAEDPAGTLTPDTILDIGSPTGAPYQQWTFATAAAISQSVTTVQGQPVGITLSGTDLNTPAQPLTYAVTTPPAHGALTGAAPNLTYTPAAGFVGTDSFVFTAGDSGPAAPATVTVTVQPTGTFSAADGSFEAPAVGAGAYQYRPTGGPWAFTGDAGIQSNGSAWSAPAAPDGTQTAFLQGNGSNGMASQAVNFATTGAFRVSFQAARRGGQVQPVQVSVDGVAVGGPVTPAGNTFQPYNSATFTISTAGSHTLSFAATDSTGDKTTFIDLVALISTVSVAAAASATPSPVTGITTTVSVLGAESSGESGLTYAWSAAGPAPVAFSPNGTNAAKSATATFTQAGAYTLTATITDGVGGTATSSVTVTVSQTPTVIAVSPSTATLAPSGTQAFTAVASDQFGSALSPQPAFAWAATGDGTVTSAGVFTAGTGVGTATVTATGGSLTGTASVSVAQIPDGSFESPSVGAGAYQYRPTGGPWAFTGNAGIQSNGSGWAAPAAPDGTQTAILQGHGSNGSASQSVTFAQTGGYQISFQAALRNYQGGLAQPIQVTVDGVAVGGPITPAGYTFQLYKTSSFTISTPGAHTIALAATDSTGDKTAFVDLVQVTAIPSPTVAAVASATPNPVTGTTTQISVLGADAGGEGSLTYAWSATGPAAVTFSANGTNAAKSATATFSKAGAYTLKATITDAGGLSTTSGVAVTVQQTPTAVAVSPATATVVVGQTQQFTATATDQFGQALSHQPAFTWAATGAGAVNNTGLFTGVTAGPASVTAASGPVTGPAAAVMVTAAASATALSSSPNPSTVGQSVTFTATVTGSSPTGAVTFTDGGTTLGTGTVSGGVATLTTSALAAGSHSVTASYGGDGANATSASTALTQTVVAAPTANAQSASTLVNNSVAITLTGSDPNSPPQPLTYTVTAPPTHGTLSGTAPSLTYTPSGGYTGSDSFTFTASNGTAVSAPATVSLTVKPLGTTATALSSSANPAASGRSVTFTATVTGTGTGAGPTGTVTFTDGTTSLGTGTLAGGVATLSTSALAVGSHSVTASYGGDGANAASKSAALAQAVAAAPADISAQVLVQRAGLVYHSGTRQYTQPVRLTNTGKAATPGPVYLVLDGLSGAPVLVNRTGVTALTAPAGHPYLLVSSGGLKPGVGVVVTLTFSAQPSYTTRVLAGPGSP